MPLPLRAAVWGCLLFLIAKLLSTVEVPSCTSIKSPYLELHFIKCVWICYILTDCKPNAKINCIKITGSVFTVTVNSWCLFWLNLIPLYKLESKCKIQTICSSGMYCYPCFRFICPLLHLHYIHLAKYMFNLVYNSQTGRLTTLSLLWIFIILWLVHMKLIHNIWVLDMA